MPQTQRTTKTIKGEQTMTKKLCVVCKAPLTLEEHICDMCYHQEMKKDMEREFQRRQFNEDEERGENWRFTDSRGRSVFKGD